MATASAIHAITSGIAQVLSRAYQLRPLAGVTCKFEPLGISDFKKLDGSDPKVSIVLYRISHNEHLRNRPPPMLPTGKPCPLTVNLHMLITVWADSALKEQSLIAWTLRELHMRPVMDKSMFADVGGFGVNDLVTMFPEELTLDDLSKLWQVLVPPLRPSLGYVARNVMIDIESQPDAERVVATRFALDDDVAEVAEGAQ
ncbi:DUF4255 domain-containing protein [Piscinibacter terrae]|uniref:DUF4255 domain-containing protein n=1 Tax=Piscinibacter terrae TaxID=2496871 RepID=A0A3N7JJD7_9BURK|nr:DUF4255 domain-containing protein [Albitalea terrae]RQP21469.1 DUF4255 domain-containing protein [Albitalea terrae]